jgi:hypothetical protein
MYVYVFILYYVILYCIILYCSISNYNTTLYYTISYCIILYIILYYNIIYIFILYYFGPDGSRRHILLHSYHEATQPAVLFGDWHLTLPQWGVFKLWMPSFPFIQEEVYAWFSSQELLFFSDRSSNHTLLNCKNQKWTLQKPTSTALLRLHCLTGRQSL